MTVRASALLALDLGSATSSAAILGRIESRWRLLGAHAIPAGLPVEPLVEGLLGSIAAADPGLSRAVGLPRQAQRAAADPDLLPRLTARSVPPPHLAALAASARAASRLAASADVAGWRSSALALESSDRLAVLRLLLAPEVTAILVGSADPAPSGEREGLADLVRLAGAALERRPELRLFLAGGARAMAELAGARAAALLPPAPSEHPLLPPDESPPRGRTAGAGGDPGAAWSDLAAALRDLRPDGEDARDAIARGVASLAEVTDRRIEVIEVGLDGGLRALAAPTLDGSGSLRSAIVPGAALFPAEPDDQVLRGILEWSTVAWDRNRLRDRLRDLRRHPWSDAAGDGALLRIAAARAAVGRLVRATPALDGPAPDIVVASGGAWASAPGPVVSLALADVLRRPGASQHAFDAARLLGPLGTLEDEAERRQLCADLADDILVPLGTVVVAAGLHRSRRIGKLRVEAGEASSELDLVPGGLQLVDLPPGHLARAVFRFDEAVVLGARGRSFEIEVAGGLAGLIVDLRDVPLRLPERTERRRELLASWQSALWQGGVG